MADLEIKDGEVDSAGNQGAGTPPQGAPTTPPAWLGQIGDVKIPEKFVRPKPEETMAELVKANEELQKKLVERKTAVPATESTKKPSPASAASLVIESGPTDDEGVEEKINKAGLNIEDLQAKWLENHTLDESDYEALRRQGLGRKMVNDLAQGIASRELAKTQIALNIRANVEASLGGQKQHETLRQWAFLNIDKRELDAHNARIKADPEYYASFMEIVQARYDKKNGVSGTRPLATGTAASSAGVNVPKSLAELNQLWAKAKGGDEDAAAIINKLDRKTLDKLSP